MKRLIIALLIMQLSLSGCSLLSTLAKSVAAPNTSNSAKIAIGDNKKTLNAHVGKTTYVKGKANQSSSGDINNGNVYHFAMPSYYIFLLIIGWVGWCLPTPVYLFRKWRKRKQ